MNIKYTLGAILSIPLLPIMYFQGKKIRTAVPDLPEAKGTAGRCTNLASRGKALKLLTIGESTIAGVGVETHEEGFSGTFGRELSKLLNVDVEWKVFAKSGYTACKIAEILIPKIKEKEIDLIVIGLGANDAFTLNSPHRWKKDVNHLINRLRNMFPLAPIVFCNMPPIKEFPAFTPLMKFTIGNLVEILGKTLEDLVRSHQNVFYSNEVITIEGWIDRVEVQTEEAAFFSDGVHPSQLTYQTWAKDLAGVIIRNQIISKRSE